MFLPEPPESDGALRLYQDDLDDDGYVGNLTRLWAWRPEIADGFRQLRAQLTAASSLTHRELAVIVSATASGLGDAYCSLAWGEALASESDGQTAAAVLSGDDPPTLSVREAALARWARALVWDPNGTTDDEVAGLRAAGLSDREIFEATAFAAFRIAFSTVNDALGAPPDRQLAQAATPEVLAAVTFGRPPDATS